VDQKEDIGKKLHRGYRLKDRYEIISPIKKGGMSKVYLARDCTLKTLCAIKELFVHLLFAGDEREHIIKRFREEAEFLARLRHTSLPLVMDYFSENSFYYIVMEYVIGNDLESLVKEKGNPGLPEFEVMEWAIKICSVLNYLHSQIPPIIYSDLKPSNIMLRDKDGEVILVDFGSARVLPPTANRLTGIGTEGYAPPEQYAGAQDPRSDIYAMGATMHHLLTGHGPIIPFEFPPIRNTVPSVNSRLEQIIMKAVQRDIGKRYQNVEVLKKDIRDLYLYLSAPQSGGLSISSFIKSRAEAVKNNFKALMNIIKKQTDEEETEQISIMVVDDEEALRETYVEVFTTFKDIKVVATAEDGEDAVSIFKEMKVKPDVIMMDVYMPRMDGITATEKIFNMNSSVKIVMLTALSNQETVLKAFNAGAVGYIIKGARMEYLAKVVRDAHRGGSPIAPEISKLLLKEFFPSKLKLPRKEKIDFKKDSTKDISLENAVFSDILSEMSMAKFTGKFYIFKGNYEGNICFKSGNIVRAKLANLSGENAIYSFPLWSEVSTRFDVGEIEDESDISLKTEEIILKSFEIWENWFKLKEILGDTDSIFKVSFTKHYEVISLSPKELEILSHLNGIMTIAEVAHNLNRSYIDIAETIYNLSLMGVVEKVEK